MPYLDEPYGHNSRKYSAILHTKTSNKIFILQLFFFCYVFLLISHMAGKAKWIEKRSARGRPVKLVFLQCKITNCSNNHTISQDICTLFARYSV